MCSITLKLNSTSRTIGKAMAHKMTAKIVGKKSSFRFSMKIYLNISLCMRFKQ